MGVVCRCGALGHVVLWGVSSGPCVGFFVCGSPSWSVGRLALRVTGSAKGSPVPVACVSGTLLGVGRWGVRALPSASMGWVAVDCVLVVAVPVRAARSLGLGMALSRASGILGGFRSQKWLPRRASRRAANRMCWRSPCTMSTVCTVWPMWVRRWAAMWSGRCYRASRTPMNRVLRACRTALRSVVASPWGSAATHGPSRQVSSWRDLGCRTRGGDHWVAVGGALRVGCLNLS